jgi:hypothetical protein
MAFQRHFLAGHARKFTAQRRSAGRQQRGRSALRLAMSATSLEWVLSFARTARMTAAGHPPATGY